MSFKLIDEFVYDGTNGELIRYEGNNELGSTFTFSVKSLKGNYFIYFIEREVNGGRKFFENIFIKDLENNQVYSSGVTDATKGTGFAVPGLVEYTVESNIGTKFDEVDLIQIRYNPDLSRYVRLYSFR